MSNTAQNWLDTKYPNKDSSEKIELYERDTGNSEELTGELTIENYVKVEEISFTRWGKKGKITKVTIANCPQVKKIKFDNNEVTEISFKDDLPNLEWLDLVDNKIKEIDISLTPNLTRLHLSRNPNLVKISGLENSTKLETVSLLETPGLNGREFKEWKERPTKEELAKAVNDKANEFKDYINPNDKAKLEEAAKGQGMVSKEEYGKVKQERDDRPDINLAKYQELLNNQEKHTDYDDIKNELDKWKKLGETPEKVENLIKDLQSKPVGGSGTGLSTEQQQKINDYEKLQRQKIWLLRYLEKENSGKQYAKILQEFNDKVK